MKKFNSKAIDFKFFIGFLLLTIAMTILSFHNPQDRLLSFVLDAGGNIGGVITAGFFFNCFISGITLKQRILTVFAVGTGLIIYEVLQNWIPWQTFDVNDILGSLIGVVIAIILNGFIVLFSNFKERNIRR